MTRTTSSTTKCLSAPKVGGSDSGFDSGSWTRREFLRGAAGVVALQSVTSAPAQFAYVASGAGTLHVFQVQGELWTEIQRVPSLAPACLSLSADGQKLYVANEVDEHGGVARGRIETFAIDSFSGRLRSADITPLSLSATRPRHMALSPDGTLLAVAAYGGGVYNLLAVNKDGCLGRPSGIFKDTGCGPCTPEQASAHPHTLAFDADGRHLLSSDFGGDRLNVFAVNDGKVRRRMHRSAGEGNGPGVFVLHPAGCCLYVWHGLEGALVVYRYHAGAVGEPAQRIRLATPSGRAQGLAVNPSGRTLYTTQPALTAWQMDPADGLLTGRRKVLSDAATWIGGAGSGDSLFALDAPEGLILRVVVNPATGEPDHPLAVARVIQPKSLAIRTA
jgi:6-phosphogluconolactonase